MGRVWVVYFLLFTAYSFAGELRFKEYVETQSPKGDVVYGALVPHGRSPERLFSSDADPRILTTFGNGYGYRIDSKKDFFAYTKNEHLIQEIKWNPVFRHFDFLIDDSYYGVGTPHLRPVKNRETCISCHQSGGPLFSHFTWSEINESDRAFGDTTVENNISAALNGSDTYEGFKVFGSGHIFSQNILAANRFQQAVLACGEICGDDLQCKKDLLKTAFTNLRPSEHINTEEPRDLTYIRVIPDHRLEPALENRINLYWPEGGFEFTDWGINDLRLIYLNHLEFYYKSYDQLQQMVGPVKRREIVRDLDPSLPRQKVERIDKEIAPGYLFDVAFECLGFTDTDAEILQSFSKARLYDVLNRPELTPIFSTWPFDRALAMNIILKTLGVGNLPENCHCDLGKNDVASEERPTEVKEKPQKNYKNTVEDLRPISIKHFQVLCSACHSPGGIDDAPLFPLDDSVAFSKFMAKNGTLVSRKLRSNMPPKYFEVKISKELREEMALWASMQEEPTYLEMTTNRLKNLFRNK